MGWPLILALATQAAQAESGSHDEKVGKKYGEAESKAEVEAWQRDLEAQKEEARKAALTRALAAKSQPLGGERGTYVDRPRKPTMWGNYTSGPAQAGATIGGYFGAKGAGSGVSEPPKYPGAQGQPMTDAEWEKYVYSQMGE